MAQYHHLNVYKQSFDLLVKLMEITPKFRREYRYTLGEKLNNILIEFIILIYKANSSKNKERLKLIEQLLEETQKINILVRLACELRNISKDQYMKLAVVLEEIEKQLNGWKKQTCKNF